MKRSLSAVKLGARLQVYKNLNVDAWSVRHPGSRRVLAHAAYVELRGVEFRVQEGSRQAVLRLRVRRVHAYAVGEIARVAERSAPRRGRWQRFSYNPFRSGDFTLADGTALAGAERVRFDHVGAWLQGPRFKT